MVTNSLYAKLLFYTHRCLLDFPDLLWRGLPDEHGMDATPGHQNNFVVQESRFSRLKEPYPSNCYSNWNQTSYTKYVNGGKYNYSRTVRLKLNADLFFTFFLALQQILSAGFDPWALWLLPPKLSQSGGSGGYLQSKHDWGTHELLCESPLRLGDWQNKM